MDAEFSGKLSQPYLHRVKDTARRLSIAMGGEFKQNPVSEFLNRLITVHPLGGCSMGRNEKEGVVNPFGEVFNHPGLFIADGSVMPGPVGPNPSLTIAALANRTADHILANKGKS